MIKIREDVDLKELEKYEFQYQDNQDIGEESCYFYDLNDNRTYITISCDDRIIGIPTSFMGDVPAFYIDNLDILYDLIQADLVVKAKN